jgi:GMP synthase-like glutamine amidotransferase
MILVIETAERKNSLHFFEFVKPILDILDSMNAHFEVRHYKEVTKEHIDKAEKVILCGNGLQDREFLVDAKKFSWLKTTTKPVLGICAGMQIIGKVHGAKLIKKVKIGVSHVQFLDPDPFMNMMSKYDVYELHNYAVSVPAGFVELAETDIPMAFKKKDVPMYGVMFHPEVMNKELIKAFGQM